MSYELEIKLKVLKLCLLAIKSRGTLFCVLKMEAKMDQLRTLVEAADKDKVDLLNQLEEERR